MTPRGTSSRHRVGCAQKGAGSRVIESPAEPARAASSGPRVASGGLWVQHRADRALGQRHRVCAVTRVPLNTARLLSPTQCRGGSRAGSAGRRGPPDTECGPLDAACAGSSGRALTKPLAARSGTACYRARGPLNTTRCALDAARAGSADRTRDPVRGPLEATPAVRSMPGARGIPLDATRCQLDTGPLDAARSMPCAFGFDATRCQLDTGTLMG